MARKIDDRVSDHTAQLILLWPMILLIFAGHLYIWQEGADAHLNLVSAALTIFEIFIVVALAAGFWMVRREAIDRAEEAARNVARECAEREVQEYAKSVVAPKLLRAVLGGESDLAESEGDDLDDESARDMISKLG